MGYAARLNLRSEAGGKPRPFVALHRLWRAVSVFHGDRKAFDRWLETRAELSEDQMAGLDRIWREQNPPPLVVLA